MRGVLDLVEEEEFLHEGLLLSSRSSRPIQKVYDAVVNVLLCLFTGHTLNIFIVRSVHRLINVHHGRR